MSITVDRPKIAHLETIQTHMYKNEKYLLYWLSKHLHACANVLEIGSYLGASASYLAAGLRDGKRGGVTCVDTWDNDAMNESCKDTFAEFLKNTSQFYDSIIPLRGKSVDVAGRYRGNTIDLLFIDGDHTYEGCHNDWVSWRNHLSDSSIVAFHDYTRSEGIRKVADKEVPMSFDVKFKYASSSLQVLWVERNRPLTAN